MSMIKVRKGNRVYSVPVDELSNYEKNGWKKHNQAVKDQANPNEGRKAREAAKANGAGAGGVEEGVGSK